MAISLAGTWLLDISGSALLAVATKEGRTPGDEVGDNYCALHSTVLEALRFS